MRYYKFNSESAALAAEAQIVANVRAWVEANVPEALSDDKTKLRGRNAATGDLEDAFTERWAVPQLTAGGEWVFPAPTANKAAPIPLGVFTAGVDAEQSDYDPEWFPAVE